MLKFYQNTKNTIVVTLDEKVTITNPFFIFELVNNNTFENKVFYCADNSLNTERYNRFEVTLSGQTNEDVLNGIIYINEKNNGLYTYNIYQSPTITLTGLTSDNLVENGRAYVLDTDNDFIEYNPTSNRKTYK